MAEDGEWVVVNNGDVMEDLLDGGQIPRADITIEDDLSTAITRVHLSAGGGGSSSAGGCAPSWEDIRTQLSQLGYPPLACLGCTPMSGGLHCYYGTVSQLLCSVCQHWAGSGFVECDPTATREMLLERVQNSERNAKLRLYAAFPADAYMTEA
ncbi:MAG: hypothetical protein ACPIOQ_16560, partial [Promethearchaeia archaeon]